MKNRIRVSRLQPSNELRSERGMQSEERKEASSLPRGSEEFNRIIRDKNITGEDSAKKYIGMLDRAKVVVLFGE